MKPNTRLRGNKKHEMHNKLLAKDDYLFGILNFVFQTYNFD